MNTGNSLEFLYWPDCPSHDRALRELREALDELSITQTVAVLVVKTMDDARSEQFVGSPTIRVRGKDVVDPEDQPVALGCRVYRRRSGAFTPVPDPEDLRDALRHAFLSDSEQ